MTRQARSRKRKTGCVVIPTLETGANFPNVSPGVTAPIINERRPDSLRKVHSNELAQSSVTPREEQDKRAVGLGTCCTLVETRASAVFVLGPPTDYGSIPFSPQSLALSRCLLQ